MKKLLVFLLCTLLLCATPVVAFAEGDSSSVVETEGVVEENSTATEESATEGEISTPETVPEETPKETPPTFEEEVEMVTEKIEEWILANIEEIGVVITLIGYGIVFLTRVRALIKSTGTLNNNAITISKTSSDAIAKALANIENASGVVSGYEARMAALLEAFKNTAEDKARLEKELVEIKNYLATSSRANIEFSNELAELIVLANIPNHKKEELGSRHVAAVNEKEKDGEEA